MQMEVTLTLTVTIDAEDRDDYTDKLQTLVEELEDRGFDPIVEDEEELDEDLFEMYEEEDF